MDSSNTDVNVIAPIYVARPTELPVDFASHFSTESNSSFNLLVPDSNRQLLADVFSFTEAVVVTVYLAVLSIFGMVANAVTFIIIWKNPKLHKSVFYILLMSLCVSDFVSALISPLILYRATWGFYEWKIPAIFCKLGIATEFWTSCATIQHILVFALLRLISFRFPHNFASIKAQHAKIAAIVIWLETFGAGFVIYFLWPDVFPPGAQTPSGDLSKACTAQSQWIRMLLQYVKVGFPLVIYMPMAAAVLICLLLICFIVRRISGRNKVGNQSKQKIACKERNALIQLALIIASFLLGYLPDLGYRVTAVVLRNQNRSLSARHEWQFYVTAHCLLRLSECVNPLFYNLGSSNMRAATYKFFRRIEPGRRGAPGSDS